MKLGKNDGLILFSHADIPENSVKTMVEKLLEKQEIKKIFICEIDFENKYDRKKYKKLKLSDVKSTEAEFLQILEHNNLIPLTVYEIRKDSYY
ncbi:MAG: hypothetical protein JW969_07485 [Spirochaetales bacterium]|nr:hypothetical protein [Spirochaetales bacterium]